MYRSADKPDSIFGQLYRAGFVDEASRAHGRSIMALMSTLGKAGQAYPIWQWGNVSGRNNLFYKNCRRVQRELRTLPVEEQRSWYYSMTYRDAIQSYQRNPDGSYVLDFNQQRIPVQTIEHIEDMRREYTEEEFEELYENRPMSDSSRPFPDDEIDACTVNCTCGNHSERLPGESQDDVDLYVLCQFCKGLSNKPAVAAGWDPARKVDYNCIILLDEDGAVCGFKHGRRGGNWYKIMHEAMRFIPPKVPFMLDISGKGDALPGMIAEHYPDRVPYVYKNESNVKTSAKLDNHLIKYIQGQDISFPVGLITEELASIETVATSTGVKYEAPEGLFDDTVDALALAAWVHEHKQYSESYLQMSSKDKSRSRSGWDRTEQGLYVGTGPGAAGRVERRTRSGWR